MLLRSLLMGLTALLLAMACAAQALDDPAEEARAQALMRELRCVACENEPISQSSAAIAEDMRARVRVMVSEGASDDEVRDWFESRYGEFVLFRPSSKGVDGVILWGGPFGLLLIGGLIVFVLARRRKAGAEPVAPEDV
ncbi:MAG: cytochrome C biogenesis protein [Hyphomonas sp. BRH_c22]|uniref:cytochrome c-type biogenesis protein n=1 Tax=Hyphomonas sp. BRH_c22 TaxID=1629710 RepID=UPI0005F11406|nr:cytochrome c-type biogenesis protein [Hyphomonas sp. BRH_c22]KJS37299.1 MAG: cytochrome C biogenesis protein [Hyphomonas sp. BRH_c22]